MAFTAKYIQWTAFWMSCIYFLFAVTCAPNYYRLTFYEQSGLEVRTSTVEELKEMCICLIDYANESSRQLIKPSNTKEMALLAREGFNSIKGYPCIGEAATTPKGMICSEIMSYANFTGFYFPFTGEATVNIHMPPLELPFTMAHELAHTRGFMREDEANFIGYLACKNSSNAYMRYSGAVCAMNNSMNALYNVSREDYFQLRKTYCQELNNDLEQIGKYWEKYETKIADTAQAMNDIYLKSNNLSDGAQSYGRMVDLLLADFRKQGR